MDTSIGPKRKAIIFILISAFLGSMGIGLLNPVAPFLVARYTNDSANAGIILGWLTSVYAICQFIAAPGLGALSDRFGRRPILLICVLGSAVGYLVMGIGGALWVLFMGRIIDGITGGNISVAFAYIADITPPGQRGKFYGWIGAVFGVGFILGPALGGLVARLGIEAPLYVAAAVTFANVLYGLVAMPESLSAAQRTTSIRIAQLNPLSILREVFNIPQLRWLFIAIFLYSLPFAALQTNLGLFAKDSLNWDATATGAIFAFVGITDIVVQGLLLQQLINRFGESRVVIGGLLSEFIGYLLMASIIVVHSSVPLIAGVIIFAMGDGLLGPSLTGLISRAAGQRSQGQVQGGSQSIQLLARISGPLLGGLLYDGLGHASPYLIGALIVVIAMGLIGLALPTLEQTLTTGASSTTA